MSDILLDHLALNFLPVSPVRRMMLLDALKTPAAVLESRCDGRVSAKQVTEARAAAARDRDLAASQRIRIITCRDAEYPKLLKETPDRPVVLYVRGELGLDAPVAVVGTRKPSAYGLALAERFAKKLAECGIEIISGLAYGIDAVAHRGALAARGQTVAVLGSGLLEIYPRSHAGLAHEMADKGGAIVSEFPLRAKPDGKNFPQRNRIIAGLSLGALVIEAGLKSGSLITARLASEYNRQVWAAPNRVGAEQGEGALALLRQGATVAGRPEDILEDLAPVLKRKTLPRSRKSDIVTDAITDAIGPDGATIDEIAGKTGTARTDLLQKLLRLELEGRISAMPGGIYRRRG